MQAGAILRRALWSVGGPDGKERSERRSRLGRGGREQALDLEAAGGDGGVRRTDRRVVRDGRIELGRVSAYGCSLRLNRALWGVPGTIVPSGAGFRQP